MKVTFPGGTELPDLGLDSKSNFENSGYWKMQPPQEVNKDPGHMCFLFQAHQGIDPPGRRSSGLNTNYQPQQHTLGQSACLFRIFLSQDYQQIQNKRPPNTLGHGITTELLAVTTFYHLILNTQPQNITACRSVMSLLNKSVYWRP